MELYEKLYALRKRSGLSQEQLAERLNVSRQAVSKWETGAAVPESDKLVALSDFYAVSLDVLMRRERSLSTEENGEGQQEPPRPPENKETETRAEPACTAERPASEAALSREERQEESGPNNDVPEERKTPPARGGERRGCMAAAAVCALLFLTVCWAVTRLAFAAPRDISESSVITMDGRAIFLLLCAAGMFGGGVLAVKYVKRK